MLSYIIEPEKIPMIGDNLVFIPFGPPLTVSVAILLLSSFLNFSYFIIA